MSSPPNYIFDLETYSNCFLFTGKFEDASEHQVFEISDRVNQRAELLSWLSYLQNAKAQMVGFNNLNFDYPFIHELLTAPYTFDQHKAWQMCQTIINAAYGQNPNAIPMRERIIPQIDLVKINHFDNPNRRTSLKSLQFAMRSESVEDLPYDPSIPLNSQQMDELKAYNLHDVTETEKFLGKCKHLITMRQELLDNAVLTGDVLNYSDVKIGTEYLIKRIGRGKCFTKGSTPNQTPRSQVAFNSVILPKIWFRTEPFQAVHDWFKSQTIYVNSEERPKLEATLADLQFHFGVGGVHASVENKVYKSDETYVIKDIDVSGMYVAVGIANGFFPEHLGQDFVNAYKGLQTDRAQYKKGTSMNATLKLAGNGAFGNSNNSYSAFYDPKYTYSVTVNGQLQLLQLAEVLSLIPGLQIIQANTDGITAYLPRQMASLFDLWKTDWESDSRLKLEEVEYSAIWIRDVNNYLSITKNGKIKRKGAYWYPESPEDYDGVWNKDFSNMVVQKSIGAVMAYGLDPSDAVRLVTDPFDFMLRYKTPGGASVYIGNKKMLKTVRYYVSVKGETMTKVAQPKGKIGAYKRKNGLKDSEYLKIASTVPEGTWDERIHTKNKSKYAEVKTNVMSKFYVKECNRAKDFDWSDVDWNYYIKEVEKLVIK